MISAVQPKGHARVSHFLERSRRRHWLKVCIVLAGLAGVFLAVTDTGSTPQPASSNVAVNRPVFPVNQLGETYGSGAGLLSREQPDLIRAFATNGKVGYVSKAALAANGGASVSNPNQAVEWDKIMEARGDVTLPVYAKDGTAIIGGFVIKPGIAVVHPAS